MTAQSGTFTSYVYGNNYVLLNGTGTFIPSASVTATQAYIVDANSNASINVNDPVTLYVDGKATAATYLGYYLDGNTQHPLVQEANGTTVLLGESASGGLIPATYVTLGGNLSQTTCFCTGTRIRTPAGDVAVEDLRVGDLVVTAAGAHRPIRWIGQRDLDPRRHPEPQWAQPVRLRAGAVAPGRPSRDLRLSPGHAVCLAGDVLVPACALVNGSTVVQEEVESVTYWHIELDSHDLLLAEGLAAESYMDVGNRGFFAGGDSLDRYPPLPDAAALSCRPLVDGGAILDAIRERMRLRALALGWQQREVPLGGLHLVVDGVRLDAQATPLGETGSVARFLVPAAAREAWLVSDTHVPYHLGTAPDRRRLGVALSALAVCDGSGAALDVALDDPRLADGFHELSPDGLHRWTDGRLRLPAALWSHCRGAFVLRAEQAWTPGPRWIAPDQVAYGVDEASLRLAAA